MVATSFIILLSKQNMLSTLASLCLEWSYKGNSIQIDENNAF